MRNTTSEGNVMGGQTGPQYYAFIWSNARKYGTINAVTSSM